MKIHMLSAVREEVEPLRQKIKNLTERNIELERENYLLRSMTKYRTALTLQQITNQQKALTSEQIANLQTALMSVQIINLKKSPTSEQITNPRLALTSDQVTNCRTVLSSTHHYSLYDICIPKQSENVILSNDHYYDSGCFSVNTNLYLNPALKQDVTCV